jgi:hypothetical protein
MSTPWKVVTLLLVTLLSTDANAIDRRDDYDIYDDEPYIYPGWLCPECRDPAEFPGDFAAFAYNAYFGDGLWAFGSELGIPFRVYNLELQWVVIWFESVLFDLPSLLPDTMDVRLRLPTGEIITFTVVQGGPDLPVGGDTSVQETEGCGCGGGGSDEDDEFDEFDEDDEFGGFEGYEPEGVVEIVDPDEDGEFPEWAVEL